MANPTTNFGWQMPTSTDLVTDLPADFEVFGQAVDTSLVDLKGGTTGQVLSKASNTDMDFTWVAQDDSNAIQNAIVDAKGDLITATAADTPARLAVGTNGQTLVADSTTATGLKWATPASGGGMTLLHTITLSTTSHTQSGISQAYKNLVIIGRNLGASTGAAPRLRIHGRTTNYEYSVMILGVISTGTAAGFDGTLNDFATSGGSACQFTFYDYAESSSEKLMIGQYVGNNTGTISNMMGSPFNHQTAISEITFTTVAGTATLSGTLLIYGVN